MDTQLTMSEATFTFLSDRALQEAERHARALAVRAAEVSELTAIVVAAQKKLEEGSAELERLRSELERTRVALATTRAELAMARVAPPYPVSVERPRARAADGQGGGRAAAAAAEARPQTPTPTYAPEVIDLSPPKQPPTVSRNAIYKS